MRAPRVRGLGLRCHVHTAPGITERMAEMKRRGLPLSLYAYNDMLNREEFVALFLAWMRTRGLARVAMLPFGKFSRQVAEQLPPDLAVDFFDKSGAAPARPSAEADPVDQPLVVISSLEYEWDLRQFLLAKGFDQDQIVTAAGMLEDCVRLELPGEDLERLGAYARELCAQGRVALYTDNWDGQALADELARRWKDIPFALHCDPRFLGAVDETHVLPADLNGTRDAADAVLVLSDPRRYRDVYMQLALREQTRADLVLPFLPETDMPALDLLARDPAVFVTFCNFGTGRLLPTVHHLARLLERGHVPFREVDLTPVRLERHWPQGRALPPDVRRDALRGQLLTLGAMEYTSIHYPIPLADFADIENLRALVLLRDPRDVINSLCAALLPDAQAYERRCLELIEGSLLNHAPNAMVWWPALDELLDNLLVAADHPRMRFIRFEDIHSDPLATYDEAFRWLGWLPSPFHQVGPEQLAEAAHRGSFAFQSSGTRQRGQGEKWLRGKTYGSLRKGIVGDWRNNFTPRVLARFNALAGDRLARLGYEHCETLEDAGRS